MLFSGKANLFPGRDMKNPRRSRKLVKRRIRDFVERAFVDILGGDEFNIHAVGEDVGHVLLMTHVVETFQVLPVNGGQLLMASVGPTL